jgi:hypothetical protein
MWNDSFPNHSRSFTVLTVAVFHTY